MQISVQIGLNWNWPTGTELGNIQFNTIWYYPGGATAYLGGTTAYLVGVEIIRIKGRMKGTVKWGPKDAYGYCELPSMCEN